MSKVKSKPITRVRDGIYEETDSPGITAITRNGIFTGILITTGRVPGGLAARLHELVRHNPGHATKVLTRQVTR